jgi:hypothetical protein
MLKRVSEKSGAFQPNFLVKEFIEGKNTCVKYSLQGKYERSSSERRESI